MSRRPSAMSRAASSTPKDLPVFCPNPGDAAVVSSHPRVFLDIADTGEAMCPYCGTRYRLAGGPLKAGH